MAEKTINTRLVLRNAELSAWEKSDVKLLKGEMALAKIAGDQFKVRIGVGDKTWNELSDQGQLIIPAKNVEGLTEAIAALSTSYYECSDISELSTAERLSAYVEGDIAVEKKDIGETGRQEYCAYRFSKAGTRWMALDGNYSAENVYMPKNMTITYDFGKYKIQSGKTSRELSCGGMSVQTFINDAFAETKQPETITNPSFSFGGKAGGSGEVGTTYKVNGATLTFNQGSYQFGPTPDCKAVAGVKLERLEKTPYAGTTIEAASATTTENKGPGQILSINGSATNVNFIDGDVKYTYKYTVGFYTDSTISANNNIGGLANPAKCIKANATALTGSSDATFTGWRKPFWGTKDGAHMLDLDALTSGDIRGLANSGTSQAGLPTSWTVPKGTQQIIFACKAGVKNGISVTDVTNPKAPYTIAFTKYASKVQVEGANSYAATAYDVYEAHMGDPFTAPASLQISWS